MLTVAALGAFGAKEGAPSALPLPQDAGDGTFAGKLSGMQVSAALRCDDEAALSDANGPDKRPTLAVCVMGKARTFTHVAAYESLKSHVIEAFGARETFVFLSLEVDDQRGDTGAKFGATLNPSKEAVRAAALKAAAVSAGDVDPSWPDSKVWEHVSRQVHIRVDVRPAEEIFKENW
jgi:hypothetical protein